MIGKVLRIRYEITQSIGDGPIFASFAARDKVMSRDVCVRTIKQPFAGEEAFVKASGKAVERLIDVKHSGIERLFEVDEDEGAPFLVGELSPGTQLTERIKKLAPFSVPVGVSTAISIAEALTALHASGIVHGDLGAHNIAVSPDGETKLQLAGIWDSYSASSTAGLAVLPSMSPYLAPEVSQGALPTPASDIYSLGVILFQLLTGRLPFIADQPVAMALKHASDPVPMLRILNASIPVALEDVVKKALSKEPSSRYASVEAFASDLRIIQDALRFGKSVQLKTAKVIDPPPVAPKLSAVAPQTGKRDPSRWEAPESSGDVPMWLRMALVFFLSLVVFMVGGWIIFNLNRPKNVVVPDVRRMTVMEAEARLRPIGLKISVARRETNEQVRQDVILDTDPSAGQRVVEGYTIRAVLSLGSKTVEVPDVRGVAPDKAQMMLESLGLKLDQNFLERRSRTADPGMVIDQVPEARTRVERGTAIRITIATDKPERQQNPELNSKYVYDITIKLTDIEEPVNVRVDMTDSRGTKTVHEEEHLPRDEIQITAEGFGPQAIFKIFYNGDLIKQITKKADEGGEVPQ